MVMAMGIETQKRSKGLDGDDSPKTDLLPGMAC
jgi:hypothetical protein